MSLFRRRRMQRPLSDSEPHFWTLHEEVLGGGELRFLLGKDDDFILTSEVNRMFEEGFAQIRGVKRVSLYETYVVVGWSLFPWGFSGRFKPLSSEEASREPEVNFSKLEEAIIKIGLQLLVQYFDWQSEIRIVRLKDRQERDKLKQQKGLTNRWVFGER